MSDKDVDVIVELLQIFASVDEEKRTKILEFSQTLIEHPDLEGLTSQGMTGTALSA